MDYSFIYDGSEDCEMNHRENPTGEIVIPSIRWEALRAGIEDARILLFLKDLAEKNKCSARAQSEIQNLLEEAGKREGGSSLLTDAWMVDFARRLRRFYDRMLTHTRVEVEPRLQYLPKL